MSDYNNNYLQNINKLRLIYFLSYFGFNIWYPLFNLYLKNSGFKGYQIGLLSSIYPLNLLIFQPIWGFNADKYGRKKLVSIALIITSISLVFFNVSNSYYLMFIQIFILTFAWTTIHPLFDSIALDYISVGNETKYSTIRVWGSIGWTSASIVLTMFVISNTNMNFHVASIFPLTCFVILLTIPSIQKGLIYLKK